MGVVALQGLVLEHRRRAVVHPSNPRSVPRVFRHLGYGPLADLTEDEVCAQVLLVNGRSACQFVRLARLNYDRVGDGMDVYRATGPVIVQVLIKAAADDGGGHAGGGPPDPAPLLALEDAKPLAIEPGPADDSDSDSDFTGMFDKAPKAPPPAQTRASDIAPPKPEPKPTPKVSIRELATGTSDVARDLSTLLDMGVDDGDVEALHEVWGDAEIFEDDEGDALADFDDIVSSGAEDNATDANEYDDDEDGNDDLDPRKGKASKPTPPVN